MSRTPTWSDWIGGYVDDSVPPIQSTETRKIENNAAVMAWWLRSSLNWSDTSAAVFIAFAWTYANCDSYRGFLHAGTYATGAVVGLGAMDTTTAQNAGITSGAPATQLFYLCNPQYPDRVWNPAQTSYTNWAHNSTSPLLAQLNMFYIYWKGVQRNIVDADEWADKFTARAQWVYANINNLKLIDEWTRPAWLYFEMSKRKKGGGKLYL